MRCRALLLVLMLLGGRATIAQALSGQLLDQASHRPLGFVSVGVLRQPYGTVADAQGHFTLNLPPSYDADSIRFSLLGYASRTLRVADLRRHVAAGPLLLSARAVPLAEAQVKAHNLRQRVLGRGGTILRFDGFLANMAGNQVGQLISVKRPAFLEEVSLRFYSFTYDTVYFRLNVYQLHDGYPAGNILPQPVYYAVSHEQARRAVHFNLRPYHLYLTQDVVVALELVRPLGKGELWFQQPLSGGGPHYRLEQSPGPGTVLNTEPPSTDSHDVKRPQPDGPWTMFPHIGIGLQATVLELPE